MYSTYRHTNVELLAEDLQGKLGASDDIKQLIAAADTNGKQLLHQCCSRSRL